MGDPMNRTVRVTLFALSLASLSGCVNAPAPPSTDPMFLRTGYGAAVAYEVNSPGWLAACARRYRAFNPDTGRYVGADGRQYYCML